MHCHKNRAPQWTLTNRHPLTNRGETRCPGGVGCSWSGSCTRHWFPSMWCLDSHMVIYVLPVITKSQFNDWQHIVHQWSGNFYNFKNFLLFIYQVNIMFTVKKGNLYIIWDILQHTASKIPKVSDLLVKKKKRRLTCSFSRIMEIYKFIINFCAMLFKPPTFCRAFFLMYHGNIDKHIQ